MALPSPMEDLTLQIFASNCPIPVIGKAEEDRAENLSLLCKSKILLEERTNNSDSLATNWDFSAAKVSIFSSSQDELNLF